MSCYFAEIFNEKFENNKILILTILKVDLSLLSLYVDM